MGEWKKLTRRPHFRAAHLDCALARAGDGWERSERDVHLLAFPYRTDAPFPLTELFCFAEVREQNGEKWVLYGFDAAENVIFLQNLKISLPQSEKV